MVLSSATVIPYLLERGLLSTRQVLDEPMDVRAFVSRNRGFRVNRPTGGWWVKQPKRWDRDNLDIFEREARCYWLAREQPAFAALASLLPRCDLHDPRSRVLVLELIEAGPVSVTPENMRALADALALYQGIGERGFGTGLPWALSLAEPGPKGPTEGKQALLEILRRYPDFRSALAQLRGEWRPSAFLHGDMKLENCLVRDHRVWILDWELAAWGDSAWDVGGLLQSCWCRWIDGQVTLEELRAASRVFAAAPGIERTMRYAAARLIQTAWERLQRSSSMREDAARMLQLSQNVFARPGEAARELLGA
ncbi:MAG: aminoglycoside phosphotransferase family protein [Bryobacteraceae bacterium]|nr:aminoglycoside phosphotransferase family protein [Bryobacteraceae bacterium]